MITKERTDGAHFAPWSSSNARTIVYMVENRIEDGQMIEGEELKKYKISNRWLQEMHAAAARTELVAGLGLNAAARLIGNKAMRRLTYLTGAAFFADSARNFLESELRKGVGEMIADKDRINAFDLNSNIPSFSA